MKGPGGKGEGKPGRGKGKGKGKGKDKGKGKGCGAGVGSTYANPGRPKSFQPTQQDRQRTGNIAEYFRRREHTPRPVAPVFASAQMRGGLEGSRPRASRAADVTVSVYGRARRCRGRQHTSLLYRYQMQCTFGVQSV
jgi:hypothetical protein